ncbi:ABC transporter ATP-binding protein [Legionella pneumophila serogroup 1]|uniref:ABC transporter ATP-binding protein n=1 Tax=Legionella pneumophila TaxID=446 RepID=UPI000770AD6F|nr:ABC transporter ATP-binding protein [Legionella pneumophila]MCH9060816.1 ABC transporter ATP-binding protein [Legionella pneumophila serogroup 1]MCH9063867.1 ABC transporter ATP-binding protein [Legionella pneumophila serogroup 1]MCH9066567.1 ABC transporter ATP-binding protein [Legionella pneumophila serogroup 1]MCH9068807.1 ABC transporter ATP-binding protein [Legionella pneumophila serogroup 1]MCH9072826.1 ABC transporter ATP-binding protein [Legionella pneumophila serogroup 1]
MIDRPLIQLSDLVKTYHLEGISTTVLKAVSLTVNEGDLLAIVGASGSGKSTLMNIIGLLDKPDTGTYTLNNRNVASLSDDEAADLRNQNIGFVFQQFNLLPRFTAMQNVALPLTYRGVNPTLIKEKVEQALDKVGMRQYIRHRPTQLSGGQQQRVAIARALVTDPQVILADEPTGALDSRTGSEVMNLFLALHQEGRTIIMVTHDEHVAAQCKRRITLADGAIIAECGQ